MNTSPFRAQYHTKAVGGTSSETVPCAVLDFVPRLDRDGGVLAVVLLDDGKIISIDLDWNELEYIEPPVSRDASQ